jgi:hypothetical protein
MRPGAVVRDIVKPCAANYATANDGTVKSGNVKNGTLKYAAVKRDRETRKGVDGATRRVAPQVRAAQVYVREHVRSKLLDRNRPIAGQSVPRA